MVKEHDGEGRREMVAEGSLSRKHHKVTHKGKTTKADADPKDSSFQDFFDLL